MADDHFRVIDGGDAGNRDLVWLQRMSDDHGYPDVKISDRTPEYSCLGIWGPNARTTLQAVVDEPDA